MKIQSNNIIFMDVTDTRKVDIHISSNHPTVQIFDLNSNERARTPDWSVEPLELIPTVYADSTNVTGSLSKFEWRQIIGEEETILTTINKVLTIAGNQLSETTPMIRYKFYAWYNNTEFSNEIVFSLITAGKNGTDGYTPQKGVDYFDGKNGQDGKSVSIKGVAYTNESFVAGAKVTLYSVPELGEQNKITTGGDADTVDGYLVDGYLCVYTGEYFIWTGKIQGPQGDKGESTFLYIRYADDQNGNGFDPSPIGKKYIGFYRSPEESLPNDINRGYDTWKWTKYIGDDAKSISLSASTQVFRVGKDGKISPEKLTITPHIVNTSITDKLYSINGNTFSTTLPSGLSIDSNNKITITGASMTANSIAIRMGDGTYSDTLTIYKVYDGDKGEDASIVFLTNENITFAANSNGQVLGTTVYCDVVAYTGTAKVTPDVGIISSGDLPDGMSLGERTTENNQVKIPIIIADNVTLGSTQNTNGTIIIPIISPVETDLHLTWSKVNSGAKGEAGVGISSVTVTYGVSTSASTQPTSWQSSVPTVADGSYLWTRTITDYTDNTVPDTVTYTYAKQGDKGDKGSTGSSVTVSKIEYQSGTSATIAPTNTWSSSVVSVAEGNYLWTKTTFSDSKVAYGVAKQGAKGDKGDKGDQGIQGIQGPKGEQGIQGPQGIDGKTSYFHIKYSANANGNPMTEIPSTYIGTYVDYTEADSTDYTKYTWSRFVGSQGAKGDQGIAGTNGTDGQTSYLHIAYATSANGSSGFSVSDSAGKTYIGQYTDHTQADSTDYTKYKWTLIKGEKGDKGDQGVQGPKGNDGQQYYTWVKYADTPTSGMSNDPDGKSYIGLAYNKTTATESNTYSDYMWSLIKGETGAVGPKGADGQQYYTWIKYADNASGANMSDSPNGKSYIGLAYNKTTSTESTTASDYTWALFKGDKGTAAVTFQVYAPNGYLLTKELDSLTLQAFAYEGSAVITSGATYQWSQLIDEVWTVIEGATSTTYTVTQADVLKAKSYRCVMTYKNQTYISTVTVQDKTDTYNSIMCISSNATNNDCYWVLYTLVYSDTEEVDPLLGPISINAPSSPESGDYWYSVDSANATVTLKKYNGTSWENSTDKQSLSYYWDMINDGSAQIPLGDSAKVKVISCHDFTSTATLICEVSNLEDGLLTQSSLSLTDASDPIVSDTEPTVTVNGQIWIKPNDNGTYLMFIWDESASSWISSDMDTRSKVYTSRPSSYNAGDLWITASDTDHGSYLQGTLLQAQAYNTTYNAADWSPTLRYDQDLDDMKETLNNLSQYVTITSSGLRVAARDDAGNLSEFTSLFTSEALTFYQGSKELLILANNQLTAPKIVVEDELEVQGEIKLGDLKLIIESNGSFSFAIEK